MTELPTALEYTTVHVTIQDLIENAAADTKGKVIYTPLVTTVPGIEGKIHQVDAVKDYLVDGSSSVNLLTGITWRAEFALQGPIPAPDAVEFTTDGTTINLAYEVTAENELVESRTVVVAGVATTAALTAGLAGKQDAATLEADTAAKIGTGGALDTGLDARYVGADFSAQKAFPGGRKVLIIGDSIVNGSSASSTDNFLTTVAQDAAGSEIAYVTRAGYPGERSDEITARLAALLDAGDYNKVVYLAGTNDASQLVAPATYVANVEAARAICATRGLRFITGTIPPRGSGANATEAANVRILNLALTSWAAAHGVSVADRFAVTVDATNGEMQAAMDSGDGTHPNDAGHAAIGVELARVFGADYVRSPWPVTHLGGGLLPNPLNDPSITPGTAGWVAVSGVATSVGTVAPSSDDLDLGNWFYIRYNNGGGGSVSVTRQMTLDASGYAEGDRLAVFFKMKVAGGALGKVTLANTGTVAVKSFMARPRMSPASYGGYIDGYTVTAADVTNGLKLQLTLTAPAGNDAYIYIGQQEVYNLTEMGQASLY